ncbi:MAG TPA: cyanophycin synthetase, partial [bacterium]|nr:cyanophycin synthetase [bacterium]
LREVPGRLNKIEVNARRNIRVVVDFAHTPDAMKKTLEILKQLPHNRLIALFGCGGDRDRTKRPLMGEAAVELCDFVFLTSDNPRTEDPEKIILDIMLGIKKAGKENYKIVQDRSSAIMEAVRMLDKGDVLALLGKGHEKVQIVGEQRIPFSDYGTVMKYLKERFGAESVSGMH